MKELPTVEGTGEEILDALPEGTIGWLLTANGAAWFRKTADSLDIRNDHDLASAFEIVAFTAGTPDPDAWHWHRTLGRPTGILHQRTVPAGEDVCRQMLLDGHVVKSADGWSTVQGAAATRFQIPIDAQPGQLVSMELVEVTAEDDLGNVRVVDTVPIGLTPCAPVQPKEN